MTLAEIQEEAKILISSDNVPGSLEFAEKLEKSLLDNNIREANPNAYRELSKIIFQLYVTAIPNLEDDLLFNIISFNLIEALNPIWPSERDLAARIESKYSIYPIELIKEMMRKDLLTLVEKNNQQIGNIPLRLSQDNPQAKPTIANWIEYYNRSIGINTIDPFERSRFISNNPMVQTLTPEEKENLRRVVSFYDYLKNDETVLYADINSDVNNTNIKNNPVVSTTNIATKISPTPNTRPAPTLITPKPTPNPSTQSNFTAVQSDLQQDINNIIASTKSSGQTIDINNTNLNSTNGISSETQFNPQPIPARAPIPPRTSSAPIVLTAKPLPIPKNVVNLKKPD